MQSNPPTQRNALPYLILFAGVLATSSGAILVRLAQGTGIPSLWIAAARLLLATAILSPMVIFRHRRELASISAATWLACAASGAFLAVHFAAWISSLEYTSIASSVVLVSTTPIWVSLYSGLTGRERVDGRVIVGLCLAVIGGVIVTMSEVCTIGVGGPTCQLSGSDPLLGNLLALCGGIMAAGYLLVGKQVQKVVPTTTYIFVVYGFAGILLAVGAGILAPRPAAIPDIGWVWLVGLAVIPQLIGHTSYNWSLKHFPATYVSTVLQGEPIGSTLLGILLFAEIPGPVKVMGGLVILAGILVVSLRNTSA
jgi:drug/metabolite transporter (DMT)-like permease